ncbi:MAG: hypothetical protein GX372_05515 [Ignavibacteria bacterium]|jgi:hypothetical protein|nr:hypothetical protein [Ignavibacteria bacterium]
MNIKEIKAASVQNFEIPKFKPEAVAKNVNVIPAKDVLELSKSESWSKDILAEGLKMLENKMQVANNSTASSLDKLENKPIESLEEALGELKLLLKDEENFVANMSGAQANISPDVIKELFEIV